MSDKTLFKLWAEKKQLARFKALAKRKKLSVAWLMRQAFDEFLKKQKG
jgi:Ribbon-helix-helix protein, copG family